MDKQLHNSDAFDEQFNELPIPDMEQSWQSMKVLLDRDDRDRKPPFVLLRSCAGWGMLGALLLAGVFFLLQRSGQLSDEQNRAQQTTTRQHPKNNTPRSPNHSVQKAQPIHTPTSSTETPGGNHATTSTDDQHRSNRPTTANPLDGTPVQQLSAKRTITSAHRLLRAPQNNTSLTPSAGSRQVRPHQAQTTTGVLRNTVPNVIESSSARDSVTKRDSAKNNTIVPVVTALTQGAKDSVRITASTDSLNNVDSTAEVIAAKKPSPKRLQLSGGIGLQQGIPFSGQQPVPYNYYGRKGSLSDYIPSAYLKLEREGKWYLMGEFRYGAPQSLKEFSYSRNTKYDTATQALTTTTLRLKKTYYHQLPLSFNYYVRKNWSVGVGGIYSRFYGAVAEQEVKRKDIQTQTETVTRELSRIHHFTDPFLYKTQVHLLLQTDFHWRRFDLGLRYTKDIQPYIRYTRPDGVVNSEKNQSLQVILRYRLFGR